MAMELITGKAGTPHIDSADIGAYQAYTVGDGVYILHGIEAAVATANSVTVTAGYGQGQGRAFAVKGAGETLTIDSGQSGYKRNDVIAVHYTKDGAGIERTELVVIKGTPASSNQVDPPMPNNGNVLNGATDAYWPLYRVTVDGLAPQAPVQIAGGNPIEVEDTGWQTLSSGTGWFVEYRRIGKLVEIRGESAGKKTLTAGDYTTYLGTLPADCVPSELNHAPYGSFLAGQVGLMGAVSNFASELRIEGANSQSAYQLWAWVTTAVSYWHFNISYFV